MKRLVILTAYGACIHASDECPIVKSTEHEIIDERTVALPRCFLPECEHAFSERDREPIPAERST